MNFTETTLKGAWIVDLAPHTDERGFFSRSFCRHEFDERGLVSEVVQCNVSLNHKRGTLRGMHFQRPPFEEVKLVRCTRGEIYDVIIDLRPESPTYTRWIGVRLSQDNHRALYVPERFAHGFQALTDNAELTYQVSQYFAPGHASGVMFNDPAFDIEWPLAVSVISTADSSWPRFEKQTAPVDMPAASNE